MDGEENEQTVQSLNKAAASQGLLCAELLCHTLNMHHMHAHTKTHLHTLQSEQDLSESAPFARREGIKYGALLCQAGLEQRSPCLWGK